VVPYFVRDDVRLRELTTRAELAGQLPEEAEVEIDVLVARAINGPVAALPSPQAVLVSSV